MSWSKPVGLSFERDVGVDARVCEFVRDGVAVGSVEDHRDLGVSGVVLARFGCCADYTRAVECVIDLVCGECFELCLMVIAAIVIVCPLASCLCVGLIVSINGLNVQSREKDPTWFDQMGFGLRVG